MAWTYFLMWDGIPPEEMEKPYATGDEQEALEVGQRIATESGRAVAVYRVQEGIAESAPFQTLHPANSE